MKIQELAIIFIIIILPISLLLSEYTQFQIQTINTQTVYDAKLTTATYDAIKAFQLNSTNSSTSDLANSKIRDIEASVNAFRNSIMTAFELNGYTEEALNNYIPALVYTLYDGFYIYSPYENVNYKEENGEKLYGLKPYISYSCRYQTSNIDVVITYALDNYITVQGMIGNEYVNEGGYLIDGITVEASGQVKYKNDGDEVRITTEQLKEYLPLKEAETGKIPNAYPYIKLNGTKYYNVDLKTDVPGYDSIIYMLNGKYLIQCQKSNIPEGQEQDQGTKDYISYKEFMENYNNLAIQYYKDAAQFTKKIRDEYKLINLKYSDAVDVVINKETGDKKTEKLWPENDSPIFDNSSCNIENELSNFNQHRLAVIRNKIETNLAVAISNYNSYSGAASSNVFQMPELKEDEWEHITHNISLISFLQGISIGGKVYNGYSLVTNSESKEVVIEDNIYILGDDENYHRIGDNYFQNGGKVSAGNYGSPNSAGRLNLDFERLILSNDIQNYYYYPLEAYNGSYDSIIMQNDVTLYDDIYEYVGTQSDELKVAFYTALGREKASKYNSKLKYSIEAMLGEKYIVSYAANSEDVTGLPGSQTKIEGIGLVLDDDTPKREGYSFKGWSTSPDGEVKYPRGIINYYDIDDDVTLYAIWEINEYTVTYNANGGSGAPSNQTKTYGQDLTLSSTKPTRTGYTFLGWSTSQTATSATYAAGGTFATNADTTLYAVWKRTSYTITFNANGGSVSQATKEVVKGETYGELPIPTRTGYSFNGWFTGSATHDNLKAYKDHPWLYYADEYSDLYNAFGYNEESLKNHYNNNGKGEGRRISEYISTDTVDITSNITVYAGWTYVGSPIYTYTGKSTFIDDGNGNWRIKFLTSGTLTFTNIASTNLDVFCVGGGGGGGSRPATGTGGGGGGGGYTTTSSNITITLGNSFNVTIGAGGAANGGRGGTTSFLSVSAAGGYGGSNGHGGAGGSGRRRWRRNWLWRWLSLV